MNSYLVSMRFYIFWFCAISLLLNAGCKKCDADMLSGRYLVSGERRMSGISTDSSGHLNYYNDTLIVVQDTIIISSVEGSIVELTRPTSSASTSCNYNKGQSTAKVCYFVTNTCAMYCMQLWFYKDGSYNLKVMDRGGNSANGWEYEVTGFKL